MNAKRNGKGTMLETSLIWIYVVAAVAGSVFNFMCLLRGVHVPFAMGALLLKVIPPLTAMWLVPRDDTQMLFWLTGLPTGILAIMVADVWLLSMVVGERPVHRSGFVTAPGGRCESGCISEIDRRGTSRSNQK
ncbi:MAG: hypothetical protein PF636_01930 [Actinomycetota bacterium]|jgi:hypothetical protein|nr:hypothetical protein [Actinomycetota bacterium]